MAAISLAAVKFAYPGARRYTLRGLDLVAVPGQLLWVTGTNGSGKSTALRVAAGVIPAVIEGTLEGEIAIVGETAMVMQDAGVYLFRTVREEVAFPVANCGVLPAEIDAVVERALTELDIAHLVDRLMHTLSGGERQKVAVAAALAGDPDVILLDEPAEQLDPSSAAEILVLAQERAERGTAVVVATRNVDAVPSGAAHLHLVDGAAAPVPAAAEPYPVRTMSSLGGEVLRLDSVTHLYPTGGGIRNVSLSVRAGESVALLGPNGAGKTTAMKHANGLLRAQSGNVVLADMPVGTTPVHELARVAGLLFQNPDDQIFNRTVLDEVAWGLTVRGADRTEAADRAREVLDELGIGALAEVNPHEVTASERQLTAFAAVLVTSPALLVLDEPTKALDRVAAEQVAAAIDCRLARGVAALIVTHDLPFAARTTDRAVVIAGGQVIADRPTADVLADPQLLRATRLLRSLH